MKLDAIPLNYAGASKQHKRMPQKVSHCNIKALGCFKAQYMCILLEFSPEFPVDPYYEPLAWFMIKAGKVQINFEPEENEAYKGCLCSSIFKCSKESQPDSKNDCHLP